jgi:NAD(P)-dependent dehydrogenase (short-subunit alcohol dehydrogenase family)
MKDVMALFDVSGKNIVMTGGTGVLGAAIVRGLVERGANVVLLSRDLARGQKLADDLKGKAGTCRAVQADVLDKPLLQKACDEIRGQWGRIDVLINGAGGNHPSATTNPSQSFFDLTEEGLRFVSDLNLLGVILPSQVFGKMMAEQKEGIILNVSSMAAFRPMTRVAAYAAAKAAISNFTQWLAVHMAQEYSSTIRVNAIAPGFFLTEQNRFLLTDKETGELTARGKSIIAHTPMGRFGSPDDLVGAVLWLLSPASQFVTGVIIPVDGGFSAFSGV